MVLSLSWDPVKEKPAQCSQSTTVGDDSRSNCSSSGLVQRRQRNDQEQLFVLDVITSANDDNEG